MSPSLTLALSSSAAAALLLLIFLAAALMFLRRCMIIPCCRRGSPTDDPERRTPVVVPTDESSLSGESTKEVRRFTWREIESLTASFTTAVIGEGGFSTVYLARLPDSSSTPAAVKVQRSSERLHRAFLQERDVLLRVNHPNIVRLLGYSDDREEGVLVLEYVPNGTLHQNLHGSSVTPLTWSRRMTILFQIASAIDHLHDGCDLQIVHGDVTASNVLLDGEFTAKLCDLGSARVGFSAAVKPAAAGHLLGSPGYADPHYLRTGIISKKSDVYSFGVMIWEMVSGIPAVRSEDERMLTAVMREADVAEMVDPRLGGRFDVGEMEVMGELAGACCGAQPGLRPSMGEIVRIMRERVKL